MSATPISLEDTFDAFKESAFADKSAERVLFNRFNKEIKKCLFAKKHLRPYHAIQCAQKIETFLMNVREQNKDLFIDLVSANKSWLKIFRSKTIGLSNILESNKLVNQYLSVVSKPASFQERFINSIFDAAKLGYTPAQLAMQKIDRSVPKVQPLYSVSDWETFTILLSREENIFFTIAVAWMLLPYYEKQHPEIKYSRKTIQSIVDFMANPTQESKSNLSQSLDKLNSLFMADRKVGLEAFCSRACYQHLASIHAAGRDALVPLAQNTGLISASMAFYTLNQSLLIDYQVEHPRLKRAEIKDILASFRLHYPISKIILRLGSEW